MHSLYIWVATVILLLIGILETVLPGRPHPTETALVMVSWDAPGAAATRSFATLTNQATCRKIERQAQGQHDGAPVTVSCLALPHEAAVP
jgi:hypothetical protein